MRTFLNVEINNEQRQYLTHLILSRMEVLKKREVKKHFDDWYDLAEWQINEKVKILNNEYFRLDQMVDKINPGQ